MPGRHIKDPIVSRDIWNLFMVLYIILCATTRERHRSRCSKSVSEVQALESYVTSIISQVPELLAKTYFQGGLQAPMQPSKRLQEAKDFNECMLGVTA